MSRTIKVVIVVALAVVTVLLTPLMLGIRSGAPWFPETPPAETARVTHTKGFSIIPPPGWVVKFRPEQLNLQPGTKGMRYTPGLSISVYGSDIAPDLSRFHETVFTGLKAYEMTLPVSGGGDVPYLRYHVYLKHGGYWYELFYVFPNGSFNKPEYSEVPDTMMRYIRSFRPAPEPAANISVQATPDYTSFKFLSQVSGAPDRERSP